MEISQNRHAATDPIRPHLTEAQASCLLSTTQNRPLCQWTPSVGRQFVSEIAVLVVLVASEAGSTAVHGHVDFHLGQALVLLVSQQRQTDRFDPKSLIVALPLPDY